MSAIAAIAAGASGFAAAPGAPPLVAPLAAAASARHSGGMIGDTADRQATGGCHCGRVRFSVRFASPPVLLDCNCSICAATGYLHLITRAADFTLLRGADRLTDYRWGSGSARHLFCTTCGIKSFYVPRSHPDGFSVNWRTIDGVGDVVPVIRAYDGRNWEAARAAL